MATRSDPPPPPHHHVPEAPDPESELRSAKADVQAGLSHLWSAATKLARHAEPTLQQSMKEGERALQRLAIGSESMGRGLAAFATKLAVQLRAATHSAESESTQHFGSHEDPRESKNER